MENTEHFTAGHSYQVVLEENIWYELWCDGSIVAERYAWPLDPTTKQPLVKNKLIDTQTRLCLEESGRKKEMD